MMTAERWLTGDEARDLILAGEAPAGLRVRGRLDLANAGAVELPPGLRCYHLDLRGSGVRALPAGLAVEYKLDLQDCRDLEELPEGLTVGSLVLRGCWGGSGSSGSGGRRARPWSIGTATPAASGSCSAWRWRATKTSCASPSSAPPRAAATCCACRP